MLCLVGCVNTVKGAKNYTKNTGRLLPIAAQQDLYYDINTKVVYILFSESFGGYTGYGYMSPYLADNGKPYLYDNGSLVKIE